MLTKRILTTAIATGAGPQVDSVSQSKTYSANGTTTAGAGAASVRVEGSNDGLSWDVIGTIGLVLATTTSSDGFVSNDTYALIRGNVTSISGTGASVNLNLGA